MQTQTENHIPKKQVIYVSGKNMAVLEDNWVILSNTLHVVKHIFEA